ncbi:uncharacterized protein MELLADRAFT_74571 [Melampsora larici-populina 98AG31]|uniref:Secreted protein n=1 Tax=Melampsora larici-populina (strain 98AG31 / pathotype 3-4-7) TaxID=747676 RepID=F4RH18_MELLP|nr:uncharacterized protein MELLADRAFT_74571 [Melampsora larici-populina 98AG31]EGG08310.1 secreted protein [Melampsora larici-populina 98AG31]
MSALSRSMNLSALAVGVVLVLIAQVHGANPPAQTTARICSGPSIVAYIAGPNNRIYPANGQGSPSGQARCTGTATYPDLQIDAVPSFPLGSNPYCAAANGDCVKPPPQVTSKICSGQGVVAYIAGPNNRIYPANGKGTPSGQARCTPSLQIDSNPSFPLGDNPYCAAANGACTQVA